MKHCEWLTTRKRIISKKKKRKELTFVWYDQFKSQLIEFLKWGKKLKKKCRNLLWIFEKQKK